MSRRSLLLLVACIACAGVEPTPSAETAEAGQDGAELGFVLVSVSPEGADAMLRVDERVLAVPPEGALRMALAPGPHVLDVAAPGFQIARTAVIVETDRELAVHVELQQGETAESDRSEGNTGETGADERAEDSQDPSAPERVARGAAGEVGKRTKGRVVREYRSLIDRALDYLIGWGRS